MQNMLIHVILFMEEEIPLEQKLMSTAHIDLACQLKFNFRLN